MLTKERADILTGILIEDAERTKNLLALDVAKATEQINSLGNDFSIDEIEEYGEELRKAATQNANAELDAEALDDVAGGALFLPIALAVTIIGTAVGGGYIFGKDLAQK